MKLQSTLFILLFTSVMLTSCGVVETIFKAGMWWAFFLVFLVVVLIIWMMSKAKK